MNHPVWNHTKPIPAALFIAYLLAATACLPRTPYTRDYVSRNIHQRTGHPLAPSARTDETVIPAGVALDDGLTEDEAVAVALWNNAQFRVDLTDLALARAELIDAGLLPNPLLSFLYLFGVKGRELSVLWPLDALWQRSRRVCAAKLDIQRVADNLVQHGLALGREVLVAYADLDLAEKCAAIAREDARVRRETARIAALRLAAGDISGLEESLSRLDAARAEEEVMQAVREAEMSRAQLRALLGFVEHEPEFVLSSSPDPVSDPRPLSDLIESAIASRPDLRAAEFEIGAAGARLGWEQSQIIKFTSTLEAKEKGEAGFFSGPSAKIEIPLFNRNEGGRARASAELERAAERYVALRQMIITEVHQAFSEISSARQVLGLLREEIVPAAADASVRARKAYAVGEEFYLFVLQAEHHEFDARRRAAEASATLRRADARLKYATGFFRSGENQ